MITWLAAGAAAQSEFAQPGSDCGANHPIAGAAGTTNAVDAVRSNQATFSATNYARRVLDRRFVRTDGELRVALHWDHQQTFNVTRVPVVHFEALSPGSGCAARFQVATRPVDAWSSNVGLTVAAGRVSAFYASSITFAGPVAQDQFVRLGQAVAITPWYALGFAGLVPLWDLSTRNPTVYDLGASGLGLDWLAGANADLELLDVSLGYAATKGAYGRVAEHTLGLFATATISPNADYGYVALGGLDRLQLGELAEVVGLSTFEYTDRPSLSARFGSPPREVELPPALGAATPRVRWRTTRLAQQDLGSVVDVDLEYRLSPDPAVQRALLGVHTPWFHPSRDGSLVGEGGSALLQLGVVGVPEHRAVGVEGGLRPSGRLSAGFAADGLDLSLAILVNDPAQLELFPFEQQLVGYTLTLKGAM